MKKSIVLVTILSILSFGCFAKKPTFETAKYMRVKVESTVNENENVDIRIPMPLVKLALKFKSFDSDLDKLTDQELKDLLASLHDFKLEANEDNEKVSIHFE